MTALSYPAVQVQTHMGIRYSTRLLDRTAELVTLLLTLREFSCFPKTGDLLGLHLGGERLTAAITEIEHGAPEEDWAAPVQLCLTCRLV